MSLTLAQLKAHVETDLDDVTLQRILDAELEAIALSVGDETVQVQWMDGLGAREVRLRRDAASITEIGVRRRADDVETVLVAGDYRFESPRTLVRLSGGTNGAEGWYGRIRIAFAPAVDTNLRNRVQADLCRLAIEYRGLDAEKAGDTSQTFSDYQRERVRLLDQLSGRQAPFA